MVTSEKKKFPDPSEKGTYDIQGRGLQQAESGPIVDGRPGSRLGCVIKAPPKGGIRHTQALPTTLKTPQRVTGIVEKAGGRIVGGQK